MKNNILFFLTSILWGTDTYAGIFDFFGTAIQGVKNLVTTGGKQCTRCGEPYNVRCMDHNGNPEEFVPFMIESCFAPFEGGCRPTPEIMDNARKYCSDKGWILNEKAAAKEDNNRGLANNQVNSVTSAVNGLLPAATAVGGIVAGIATNDGAAAEAGAQAGASMMQSQNDKESLKLQKKQLNMQSQYLNQQASPVQQTAFNPVPENAPEDAKKKHITPHIQEAPQIQNNNGAPMPVAYQQNFTQDEITPVLQNGEIKKAALVPPQATLDTSVPAQQQKNIQKITAVLQNNMRQTALGTPQPAFGTAIPA